MKEIQEPDKKFHFSGWSIRKRAVHVNGIVTKSYRMDKAMGEGHHSDDDGDRSYHTTKGLPPWWSGTRSYVNCSDSLFHIYIWE